MLKNFIIALLFIFGQGCTTTENSSGFVLSDGPTHLTGWLRDIGELVIFSDAPEDFDRTDGSDGECVTLIGKEEVLKKLRLVEFDEPVTIPGRLIRYEDLELMEGNQGSVMRKRAFNGLLVRNYCQNRFVFLIEDY